MSYNKKKHKFILPKNLSKWPCEDDDIGNIEYKRLLHTDYIKIERLATQMHWRMLQGLDMYDIYESFYVIGIDDNGKFAKINKEKINDSIDVIEKACLKINSIIDSITFINFKEGQIVVLHIKGDTTKLKNYRSF